MLESPPAALENRVGQAPTADRERLSAYLSVQGLEWELAYYLWQPVALRGTMIHPAPTARYPVIHDTSGPNYGGRPWPTNIDDHPKSTPPPLLVLDGWVIAHVIINRAVRAPRSRSRGAMGATKFERATAFGTALKGLFRMSSWSSRAGVPRTRAQQLTLLAPTPGFRPPTIVWRSSIWWPACLAGAWLIPAFHAPDRCAYQGRGMMIRRTSTSKLSPPADRILAALPPADAAVVKAER